jgi:hypothetical protein
MPVDVPLLIPVESLSHVPQLHEIPPVLSSFDSGHEVRYIPIYCFGLCQLRRRLPQCNNLKMTVRMIPCHGLSRQFNLKTRRMMNLKSTLNSMSSQLPSHIHALSVNAHSAVCKSETDTSNRTFRIRLFAHSGVVPGRVVVNGTSKSTGEENIKGPVKPLGKMQTKYTIRGTLWS